jgi:hypothetical protein
MGTGWIKIHRSIQEHWIYGKNRILSDYEAWLDILMQVNYEDGQFRPSPGIVINVKRGESVNSLDTWSKRFGWHKSRVRRFFNLLQKENMIQLKSETKSTHLTVCNYDSYQGSRHEVDTIPTRFRHEVDTKLTPIKEVKNIRSKESNTKAFVPPVLEEVIEFFSSNGGNKELAETFFKGYSVADWKDSKGSQVKNWKQKAIHVWLNGKNKNNQIGGAPLFENSKGETVVSSPYKRKD